MNNIDDEFKEIAAQISKRLNEAAKLVKEANQLRELAKLPALINSVWAREDIIAAHDEDEDELAGDKALDDFRDRLDLIDTSDFENALRDAGWSTSSSYC